MGTYTSVVIGGSPYPVTCVELKTVIVARILHPQLRHVTCEKHMGHISSPVIAQFLPRQHAVQISHQMAITHTNSCIYIYVPVRSLFCVPYFSTILEFSDEKLAVVLSCLNYIADNFAKWAYPQSSQVPRFSSGFDR